MAIMPNREEYNKETRYIEQKIIIYFSGLPPVEITRNDFLVDATILEETYSIGGSSFWGVTSNELSFSMYNDSGIFNPENTESPYYGLIKKGVRVSTFIKPVESEIWDPVGMFYITDWITDTNNLIVEVTANDRLYYVLNGVTPGMPVFRNISFNDFITTYFSYFGYTVIVDESITTVLPYVYIGDQDNREFLTALLTSVLADCFCDHEGNITILSKTKKRALTDTFTDNDQIISVSLKQSITTNFDSVVVTCNKGQESIDQNLLSINDLNIVSGLNKLDKFQFSISPVLCVKSLRTSCAEDIKIKSFTANDSTISCELQSSTNATANLDINGTSLEIISSIIGESGNAPMSIESKFIQNEDIANTVKYYAEHYVNVNTPTLELKVRGNPELKLGDMIMVDSSYYKVKYTGTIAKVQYDYQGHLSCALTLINASLIKEVT